MSEPARAPEPARDRASILRGLLEAKKAGSIVDLRDDEVETIEDAIALYEDEEGQTST